jgi:hypothetical protein
VDIVVFILALGAGTMTYRAATDYKTELAEPSAAKSQATPEETISDAAARPPPTILIVDISGEGRGLKAIDNVPRLIDRQPSRRA